MASVIKLSGGQAKAVYDDRFRPLLEALGIMQVERASEVEYDPGSGDWIATLKSGPEAGREIARGKNRADVIAQEVAYLEERL
jgi:hypothetical protein